MSCSLCSSCFRCLAEGGENSRENGVSCKASVSKNPPKIHDPTQAGWQNSLLKLMQEPCNYLLLTPNVKVMEAFAGPWLPCGFNPGCGCERESGARGESHSCLPNTQPVGFTMHWEGGKKEIYSVLSELCHPEQCREGEPICNRGYPKITRKIQCLYSTGDLYPTACKS